MKIYSFSPSMMLRWDRTRDAK